MFSKESFRFEGKWKTWANKNWCQTTLRLLAMYSSVTNMPYTCYMQYKQFLRRVDARPKSIASQNCFDVVNGFPVTLMVVIYLCSLLQQSQDIRCFSNLLLKDKRLNSRHTGWIDICVLYKNGRDCWFHYLEAPGHLFAHVGFRRKGIPQQHVEILAEETSCDSRRLSGIKILYPQTGQFRTSLYSREG